MEIQWLGTAGFRIQTRDTAFLIDPYLSRNADALPGQPLAPPDLGPASFIFVSHGHFDHIMDLPVIAPASGAIVVCSPTAARTLEDMGLDPGRVRVVDRDGFETEFSGIRARAAYSRHIRFDLKLMVSTLFRIGRRLSGILPLFTHFPCGQVLSWDFRAEGRRILFFGSGGSTPRELNRLKTDPVDVLLLPLQGHSDICAKALEYVKILDPDLVIPHHQDDFYPPVSRTVDIGPFIESVRRVCPRTRVRTMAVNEILSF